MVSAVIPRCRNSILALPGDLLDKIDDTATQLGVLNTHECFGQGKSIRGGKKVRYVGGRGGLTGSIGPAARYRRGALEEECHRYLENVRNLLQAAGTDAVGSLLVFLNLLKCQPEGVAELFLAHAQHHATHPHTTTHVFIDGVWGLLGHHNDLLCSPRPP